MSETEGQPNEAAETIAAIVLFSQLGIAGLLLALAEKRALDPERVFEFYRTLAEAIETRPDAPEAARGTGRMLRGIETLAREMVKLPDLAGRA